MSVTRLSWGGYPEAEHRGTIRLGWRTDEPEWPAGATVLPHGLGRSYGDSCLNGGGWLLDVLGLDRFIAFDRDQGVVRCESGVTLADLLSLVVPAGWFPPVLPGTRWVTVGGAVANDIHGKSHHVDGTFGTHVRCFELLRSTGERLRCAPDENVELFRATIGGLGLTGVITWVEMQLRRVPGPCIAAEEIRYESLDDFFSLSLASIGRRYSVAWVDALARGSELGRGVFIHGDHTGEPCRRRGLGNGMLRVPVDAPFSVLTGITARAFNVAYYRLRSQRRRLVTHYEPFFFPLDAVRDWNRLYGRRGFVQYQCVVPLRHPEALAALLERISQAGEASFLTVLKRFGDVPSPGLLSFPRPGYTAAFDFRFRGAPTLALLEDLDGIVRTAAGAVYPAKDARMSAASFRAFFPEWERFSESVDPAFSSSFWRRVTAGAA